MKLGEGDLNRLNWFGAKRILAQVLGARGVNSLVQFVGHNLLPVRIARRLPLRRGSVTYRLLNGERVQLLDPLHDIIARDIYWGGAQPTSRAEQLKLQCLELLSRDSGTFLDIGAYNGICALIAARSNSLLRAVAFEIVPENYELLIRNVTENGLADRVEPRLCGIGEGAGSIRIPTDCSLPSHPTSISLGSAFEGGATVAVPVASIDELFDQDTGPFLIKIDVEGYEDRVFRGARSFISRHRPDIICEVLPDAGEVCRSIEVALKGYGYRWWTFEDEAIVEKPRLQPSLVPRDWLFSVRADVSSFVRSVSL